MKPILFAAIIGSAIAGQANGQDAEVDVPVERTIRALDQTEADAVLRGDYPLLERLWSGSFTVNNPFNNVVKAIDGPVRTGALTYSSFVREIESVQVHGTTAIVMGRETVVPSDSSADAGTTIHRRYTNIWMKEKGKWVLTARHANVVCPSGR